MKRTEAYKRAFLNIGPIIFRHVFLFVNGVIFSVAILLYIFGNKESAIFLCVITFFNVFLGVFQDTRARIDLEALQLMTALRVIRLNKDGSEETVLAESIVKGDCVRLKMGDQIPCDGTLFSSNNLEVSEALITGESESLTRRKGDKVNAGDVITAGTGILDAGSDFLDSRVSHLNEEAKKYSAEPSPIQKAIDRIIKYASYAMFAIIIFVVGRGIVTHESAVKVVLDIGALASTIIPQGLVVITTLLFAFGASSYSKKHVLFQEINATEKLGRIKNLCMDKTGTLTENFLVVENMYVSGGVTKEVASQLTAAYLDGTADSSQTMNAVKEYLKIDATKVGVADAASVLPFSSWRQYGAVKIGGKTSNETVFVGSPDVFMPHIVNAAEKTWLENIIKEQAHTGKRILCVARLAKGSSSGTSGSELPRTLSQTKLSTVAAFVFQSGLREGIKDAIDFFQKRGVKIRIISGDNADTVRSIALLAGVEKADTVVTGTEMAKWSAIEFDKKVCEYTIFARIVPEQKVKIIEALKKNGFTAMVGDGANDVLAIKKADLGIAMFDGVQAARSLAGIILMNNSFTDLPGGVEMADNFIRNIEIFAGVFLNQSVIGLFLFILLSIFGFTYPLTPLNITLINYFAVGIPGMLIGYWAIRPQGKILPSSDKPFLSLVLPFVLWSAAVEAIALTAVFFMSPTYLKVATSNTLVALGLVICGLIFFMYAPMVYRGIRGKKETWHIFGLAVFELALLYLVLKIPLVVRFFEITTPPPSIMAVVQAVIILLLFGCGQYFVAKKLSGLESQHL